MNHSASLKNKKRIGLGGGCHWCTEAVFQSLIGVSKVEQGYIASSGDAAALSEAVLLSYDPEIISLRNLVEIHLHTHESTSYHSFRDKYRSAIYFLEPEDEDLANKILAELQKDFEAPLITKVLPFVEFEASRDSLHDYYFSDPEKPFCRRYIDPKIRLLLERFRSSVHLQKFELKE